jgi:uncharacterized membrane protein
MNKFILVLLYIILFDIIYLSIFYNKYNIMIKNITNSDFNISNYISFMLIYLLLAVGLYYFIILPNKSINEAFLYGLIIYGVYDLTCVTIFKKYDKTMALIDMIYGSSLFAVITYLINKKN